MKLKPLQLELSLRSRQRHQYDSARNRHRRAAGTRELRRRQRPDRHPYGRRPLPRASPGRHPVDPGRQLPGPSTPCWPSPPPARLPSGLRLFKAARLPPGRANTGNGRRCMRRVTCQISSLHSHGPSQHKFALFAHHWRVKNSKSCDAPAIMIRGMQVCRLALQGTLWPEWPSADEALVWILDTTPDSKITPTTPERWHCRQDRLRSGPGAFSITPFPRLGTQLSGSHLKQPQFHGRLKFQRLEFAPVPATGPASSAARRPQPQPNQCATS